jgi:hypothetical protein
VSLCVCVCVRAYVCALVQGRIVLDEVGNLEGNFVIRNVIGKQACA